MRELVGHCARCEKEVFCTDGFLNGVVLDNGKMICFECDKDTHRTDNHAVEEHK